MTQPTPTAPQPSQTRPIPGRIASVLKVVNKLIAWGRYFAAIANTSVERPEFAVPAAIIGTYNIAVIVLRIERGIQRALALQRYLLERAARGRNLRFLWPSRVELQPHHRPPPGPPRAPSTARKPGPGKDPVLLDPSHPNAFPHRTPDDFDAEVRRRPIGRSIAYICLDLGLSPGLTEGEFWCQIEKTFSRYGGSLERLHQMRAHRAETFQRERDQRPDTWHIDWRDTRPITVIKALGCLIGEAPECACPIIAPS